MNTEPQPTPPSRQTSTRSRRGKLLLGGAALGFLLLVIVAWLSFSSPANQSVVLISPAEAARATAPGPFAQLRYNIRQFIYPVWRHFQRRLQPVTINATVLVLPPLTAEQTALGSPATTNANGLRAWIVPAGELGAITARLTAIPGCDVAEAPSLYAANGFPASISFHGSLRPHTGPNMRLVVASAVTVDLEATPTVRPGSLSLVISASDCVFRSVPQTVVTNFEVAFKATLPPTGAVVLLDTAHTNADGKLHWLLLSATSLDAHGKPIAP